MKKIIEDSGLGLIVFKSAQELGQKIDEQLIRRYGLNPEKSTFIIPIQENFFEDGHLKVEIDETVRGKDIYLLTDIGNYSITYNMHGIENHTSPNDLIMELKDGIGACNCHADKLNVIMPLLYAGRQHRRISRENLTCGMILKELEQVRAIRSIITFDAHDESVEHAISNVEFDSFLPTNTILEQLIDNLTIDDLRKIVFVAPDNGATGRRNVYLNSFNSEYIHREAGSFVKQRDYNHFVNGKYPIIAHDYSGNHDLEGYTAIISDDMISSGSSMFDVIDELTKYGVKKVYVLVTFALFTRGIEKFNEYYQEGKLTGVYTTNLSYIPKEYQKSPWLNVCDCSKLVSKVIFNIHNNRSLSPLLRDRSYPVSLLEDKFNALDSETLLVRKRNNNQ